MSFSASPAQAAQLIGLNAGEPITMPTVKSSVLNKVSTIMSGGSEVVVDATVVACDAPRALVGSRRECS